MDSLQIFTIVVFVVVMSIIISEKIHRATVALAGGIFLILSGVITFKEGIESVDFNTLGVLLGMMLFVAVIRESGLFEYMAIKSAKIAKGDPWRIMVAFMLITAVFSAFLDNVTTVLLVGPMTITICQMLKADPVPFLMTEIISSNVGGTATLIGDPPNIMIGSAANLTFADFIIVDAPIVIVIMIIFILIFRFMYGKNLTVTEEAKAEVLSLNEKNAIKDVKLFHKSLVMIALVIVAFMLHGVLHLESCEIALAAGILMLLIGRANIEHAVSHVEWPTLLFFIGLFIIVGAMEATGVISMLATVIMDATGDNIILLMLVILWVSAILSSILDNIPFVATMIPLVLAMEANGINVIPLWWAISLGACLGGNGTLIGASANVVLSGISGKHGHPITFIQFMKIGFPMMIISIIIATAYLLLRYGL